MERYRHVLECVRACQPYSIVDVGVWNGKRSAQIIQEARKHRKFVVYNGFDLWEDLTDEQWKDEFTYPKAKSTHELAATRVVEAIGPGYAALHKGDTRETLSKYLPTGAIDFAYIDGGHSLETIESDWTNIRDRLHDGSIVLFDDYWHGRDDAGCATLVNSLGDRYNVELLGLDKIGPLSISMAKVTLRKA